MHHLFRYYTSESRFRVNRPFNVNDVAYKIDDPFPGHRLVAEGVLDERRLRQMFEGRIIDVDLRAEADIPPEPVADTPPAPPEPASQPVEPASAPDSADAAPVAAPVAADTTAAPDSAPVAATAPVERYALKNGGFGRWYVKDTTTDENVGGPFKSKDEAAAAMAALGQ